MGKNTNSLSDMEASMITKEREFTYDLDTHYNKKTELLHLLSHKFKSAIATRLLPTRKTNAHAARRPCKTLPNDLKRSAAR